MAHLANLAQTTKLTLDSREDFVVDLSSELVEKDLQVEWLCQRITTLEQQVEIRDNTIDVLENQLCHLQEELEEANDHLDMQHLEMVMHPLGLFPAEKRDDPMWCNRVNNVKDVWAMHPDQDGRITV